MTGKQKSTNFVVGYFKLEQVCVFGSMPGFCKLAGFPSCPSFHMLILAMSLRLLKGTRCWGVVCLFV